MNNHIYDNYKFACLQYTNKHVILFNMAKITSCGSE